MTAILDALAYERISRKQKEGLTRGYAAVMAVPRQIAANDELAAQHGYKVARHFNDTLSGWRKDKQGRPIPRPDWDAMLDALDKGVDEQGNKVPRVLVCNHFDRLARNDQAMADFLRVGELRGITLVSPYGVLDLTNGDHRHMLRQAIGAAIQQSDATSRRVKAEKDAARKAGLLRTVVGGAPRPGWRYGADGEWEVDPETAALLNELADLIVKGLPYTTRAQQVADSGASHAGRPLTLHRLRNALLSPISAGLIMDRDGKKVIARTEQAPLEEFKWQRVQRSLRDGPGRPHKREFALGKILRCGICGNQLSGGHRTSSEDGGGGPRYTCRNPHKALGVLKPCRRIYVGADDLDAYLGEAVAAWAAEYPELAEQLGRAQASFDDQRSGLIRRRSELWEDNARLERRAGRYMSRADAELAIAANDAMVDAINAELDALELAEAEAAGAEPAVDLEEWASMTGPQKLAWIKHAFITPIVVGPARPEGYRGARLPVSERVVLDPRRI